MFKLHAKDERILYPEVTLDTTEHIAIDIDCEDEGMKTEGETIGMEDKHAAYLATQDENLETESVK